MASTLQESSKLSQFTINGGDWSANSQNLQKNLSVLSPEQVHLAKMLLDMGQSHLFEHWPEPGVEDDEKKTFFNQVPSGEVLNFGDDAFVKFEEAGIREARNAAFVLVAGGLGERLGYNGIKDHAESLIFVVYLMQLALPSETVTGTCFLQHYVESILAMQDASHRLVPDQCIPQIPLVIMTSDDTHARTGALLKSNGYFGMKAEQVKLLKQEKVACLDDNDGRLAVDPNNRYKIQTKPHGHGDVHSLLYSSGLLNVWHDAGLKWVLFFQDTNGLLFKGIPASLGVSSTKKYQVNSLAVPRKAKEAIGGITKLTHVDGRTMVINVEYNQLDPLLRASGYLDGDVNCETGYSPFPGNINQNTASISGESMSQSAVIYYRSAESLAWIGILAHDAKAMDYGKLLMLILDLDSYIEELTKTKGAISEFVNPKYKDSTKTSFKSSTRLECMMQDYPKTLPPTARVGFTVMDTWLAYAPVKNNPEDAAKAGVQVEDPVKQVFNKQEVEVWPRVTWKPKWAITFAEVRSKVRGSSSISQRSTMVIKGQNVYIEGLDLDGALVIHSIDDAEVKVGGTVQNKGWIIEEVNYKDASVPEEIRIRGFKINKVEQLDLNYTDPGKFLHKS
ncbi:hypothetical protein Scep_002509 [Stephania cephalantha]|uniref:UTP-monosaccharide-1-phosphate uridylyltransferase n=1 Tax=Stephania cephalantha TaxID=152367 RepID=A0AAP0Q516_9MAGN